MPPKVDFDIDIAADADISADSVKPGHELSVAADEASGQLRCSTADGLLLGAMPPSAAQQLRGAIRVTVRSVKKQPDAPGKVAGIQARAVPLEAGARGALARAGGGASGGRRCDLGHLSRVTSRPRPAAQQIAFAMRSPRPHPSPRSARAAAAGARPRGGTPARGPQRLCRHSLAAAAARCVHTRSWAACCTAAASKLDSVAIVTTTTPACACPRRRARRTSPPPACSSPVLYITPLAPRRAPRPSADDPSVVLTLKDERLQQLLLNIDGAPDREKVRPPVCARLSVRLCVSY